MRVLFSGGPLHGRWIEVRPWQRVYYHLDGPLLAGRYRRRTLLTSKGTAIRHFAWHLSTDRETILHLLELLDPSGQNGLLR